MTRPGCTIGIEPNEIDIKTTFYVPIPLKTILYTMALFRGRLPIDRLLRVISALIFCHERTTVLLCNRIIPNYCE